MSGAVPARSRVAPLVSWGRVQQLTGFPSEMLKEYAANVGHEYRHFDLVVEGVNGPKVRHIDSPSLHLKRIQRSIDRNVLRTYPLPETMMGGARGRSIRDNALFHLSQPVIVALDLKDFFPRTSSKAVFEVFRDRFGCSPEIAKVLTRLTTFNYRLPQGATSSSTLANLTVLALHDELCDLAAALGLRCTFFVDDIVVSGQRADEFIEPAVAIIRRHGHGVRQKKVHRMPRAGPQIVTGIQVNGPDLSIGRARREKLRTEILEIGRDPNPAEETIRSIRAKIGFVRWISSKQGDALARLAARHVPDAGDPAQRVKVISYFECGPKGSERCRTHGGRRTPARRARRDQGR